MEFNKILDNLKIYEAGKPIELVVREFGVAEQDIVKLASNENPYGTSPKVAKVISDYAKNMFMYPDDSFFELKDALASKFSLESENFIIGAGSDQVIDFIIKAKLEVGKKVLMAKTTFAMYQIYTNQTGATILKTDSDTHNLEQFLEIYEAEKPDLIFLCLPNNPLGETLDRVDVYDFIKKIDKNTLVVVDGAYQEYASFKDEKKYINPKDLIEKFENTIYLGTFSKAYALGGMRVGYGISNKNIIQNLHKLRPPFNITTLSLKAAIEALKDEEFVNDSIAKNFEQMSRYEQYAKENSIEYIDSYTNFITYILPESIDASELSDKLLRRGIIIRCLKPYGINSIRITIGTKEQNDRVLNILDELLKGN